MYRYNLSWLTVVELSIVLRCPVGHRKMLLYTDASRCPFEMWPRTEIMLESFQCLVILSCKSLKSQGVSFIRTEAFYITSQTKVLENILIVFTSYINIVHYIYNEGAMVLTDLCYRFLQEILYRPVYLPGDSSAIPNVWYFARQTDGRPTSAIPFLCPVYKGLIQKYQLYCINLYWLL